MRLSRPSCQSKWTLLSARWPTPRGFSAAASHHKHVEFPSLSRKFQSTVEQRSYKKPVTTFAFAFDIDGVLMHRTRPIPGAPECLQHLNSCGIPFILLTNGGGKTESARVADLSAKLGVPLAEDNFVQSHTPFRTLSSLKGDGKTVLITGGDTRRTRTIMHKYGFKNVLVPGDFHVHCPELWPYELPVDETYDAACYIKQLPKPIFDPGKDAKPSAEKHLRIDAIMVLNDPRDWAYDMQLITDLLCSHRGFPGTLSSRNGDSNLPNHGWQQDGQPQLFFAHEDLHWSTGYHVPRLGLGAFQAALCGLWDQITDGNAPLLRTTIGKPHGRTYEFAEDLLQTYRRALLRQRQPQSTTKKQSGDASDGQDVVNQVAEDLPPLCRVWMVGDNPASDIKGANDYNDRGDDKDHDSRLRVEWKSMLVKTGVWKARREGDMPSPMPTAGIYDDVVAALNHALEFERKERCRV